MSSDQDGFKVPTLPISRAKPHEEGGGDETVRLEAEQDTEQSSKLDASDAQSGDSLNSKCSKVEEAKSANEGIRNCYR